MRTCRYKSCGEPVAPGEGYAHNPSWHRKCWTSYITGIVHAINEQSRATADHHGERWSVLEATTLLEGIAEGMKLREIAATVGRTYAACHVMLHSLRTDPTKMTRLVEETSLTSQGLTVTSTRHDLSVGWIIDSCDGCLRWTDVFRAHDKSKKCEDCR